MCQWSEQALMGQALELPMHMQELEQILHKVKSILKDPEVL